MKEQYLVRGRGFIGSSLLSKLPEARYLPRDWEELPEGIVINVGAYGNVYGQKDTQEIYRANLLESIRLMEQAKGLVVLLSTSSVIIPHQTHYSLSKKFMEQVSAMYPNVVVVRPSTVTGVGEQSNRLIPTLIRSCLYGEKMQFVEEPTHDFIDIEDFTDELIEVSKGGHEGEILNLSSGISYTNKQVREMVERITGNKANIEVVKSLREYDTDKWIVEDSLPNWIKKSLYQSIIEMVEHERKNNTN